ncbi:hypothetical protein CRE_20392 [Caenorhabditis remanei]|uniref:Uncharacterized protein n=1 Tax=Caenorhabditis remanei TaxID=31234 RepID=E3MD37_CAERE|nr:hypothetical protein CRE_20392 [Caenorhabditis remanei]
MMLRVLLFTSLVALSIAQLTSSCTSCNSNSNYGENHFKFLRVITSLPHTYQQSINKINTDNSHHQRRHKRQEFNSHQVPGFLPNTYRPDAFTSDARRQETLRLNQAFFDSLTQSPSASFSSSDPILTPQMDSLPLHVPSNNQQEPQYHHTFKNRPIPVVFADPEDPKHREPTIFVEVHGDDSNTTTKSSPTLEFVQFSLEPNADGTIYQSTQGNEPSFFESEATRAIIEALTRDDPRYIQNDFRLEFVDPEEDSEDVQLKNMEKIDAIKH